MDNLARECERLTREDLLAGRVQLPPPRPPVQESTHYTKLWELPPDDPLHTEWNVFRREVGRLLAEGHEGKWVLVKGEEIAGVFADEAEAEAVRGSRFPCQPVPMKKVLTNYPHLRLSFSVMRGIG